MPFLPGWNERIEQARTLPQIAVPPRMMPLAPRYFVNKINFVDSIDGAQRMLQFARQRPLSRIGWDSEFKYDRPGVEIRKRTIVFDPRSIHPLLLSLAFVEPSADGDQIYCFVIDLRKPDLLPYLAELFRSPIRFVGHFLKVEHFCLWQLGLPEPVILWDTWVAEKTRYAGRHNHHYKLKRHADEAEEAQAKEESAEVSEYFHSLVATCDRHGISHKMTASKKRLQESFLSHPDDAPFTQEQIDYAGEDAIVAALLLPTQVVAAVNDGTLHHLETIEMAWVRTNARVEWNGIKIDSESR